jgi:hypothetical protein
MVDRKLIIDAWQKRVKEIGRIDFLTGEEVKDTDFEKIAEIVQMESPLDFYGSPKEAKFETLLPEEKVDKVVYRNLPPGLERVLSVKIPQKEVIKSDRVMTLDYTVPDSFDKELLFAIFKILISSSSIDEIKDLLAGVDPNMKEWFYSLKYENQPLRTFFNQNLLYKVRITLLVYSMIIFQDKANAEETASKRSISPEEKLPLSPIPQPSSKKVVEIQIFHDPPEWIDLNKMLEVFTLLASKDNIKEIRRLISNVAPSEDNFVESRKKIMWFQNLTYKDKTLKAYIDGEDLSSFKKMCEVGIEELRLLTRA